MGQDVSYIGFLVCPIIHELPIGTRRHDIFDFCIPVEGSQALRKGSDVASLLKVVHHDTQGTGQESFGTGRNMEQSLL